MNKILLLARHAQSMNAQKGLKDIDRPLTDTGYQDASRIGFRIKSLGLMPDAIYTSNAKRAIGTAQLIAEQAGTDPSKILILDDLYEGSVRIVLNLINKLEDNHPTALIVGHNPVISHLSEFLTQDVTGYLPAGSMVYISFEGISWKEVTKGTGKVVTILHPSEKLS